MNADELLRHYERVADAPDAIGRLRKFVLDLALSGKLVAQGPTDEPASELLDRIAAKAGNGRLKGVGRSTNSARSPRGWCFVPLMAIGTWAIGSGFPKNEQGSIEGPHMFLKVSDMNLNGNEKYITVANNWINDEAAARMRAKVHPPGTIIFPKIGGAIATNKRRILSMGAAIDNNCLGLTFASEVSLDWAYLLLTSLDFAKYQAGTAVPALQQGVLERIQIGVPPLAEQHRIVAKVDELMALCDWLEAARAEREAARNRLAAATLARLNTPDPETFADDARFALEALPALTTRSNQIKQLRQVILSLAVKGKLVSRAPSVAASHVDEAQRDGTIPPHWRWVRVEEVCESIVDCPHSTPAFVASGVVCLDTNAFKGGAIIAAKVRYVTEEAYEVRTKRLVPRPGDIVFAREGSVGESVIVPAGMRCCLGQRVMLFRPSDVVDSNYFQLALSEPSSLARLLDLHKGIGAKHVNVADMRKALIALPPLIEQREVVAKVSELMAVCNQLEASLSSDAEHRSRLLEALLHRALEPAGSTDDPIAEAEVLSC